MKSTVLRDLKTLEKGEGDGGFLLFDTNSGSRSWWRFLLFLSRGYLHLPIEIQIKKLFFLPCCGCVPLNPRLFSYRIFSSFRLFGGGRGLVSTQGVGWCRVRNDGLALDAQLTHIC